MSRVFVATDTHLEREVVVKVLSPELAAGLSAERFAREIRLAAQLQEPHIVPVLADGMTAEGLPFYLMPFVRGASLRERMNEGAVPLGEAVGVLRAVARALAYAHGRGVVHRDIKPENVLLHEGTAVVTDFGIAKALSASRTQAPGGTLTQIGTSLGTPAYMSPEQASGDDVDHRADLYAWGVMAYELLAHRHPFAGKTTSQQLIAAHVGEHPEPLATSTHGVPASLAALVMRTLAKDPGARPESARTLVDALERMATTGERDVMPEQGRRVARRAAAGGVALMAVVVLIGVTLQRRDAARNARTTSVPVKAAATGHIATVAVLPFVNTGGDPKDEYFSDGMTDELAHALARLPGLRLAGHASSFAFKGKNVLPAEIGRTLDVAGLVEGTVRRAGDRLRVTAQLTSTSDGKVLWSDSYEKRATDVFAVQDELTEAIVAALAPQLRGAGSASVAEASRGTADAEAYDLYLRGRYFWAMRGAENLRRAVGYFKDAIAKDPQFARAHAGLAMTYSVLPYFMPDPADTLTLLGIANARRAIALDSTLADAHLGLAASLSVRGEPHAALPHDYIAIALDPSNATAHQWHGDNLVTLGRPDEALVELRQAVKLDPLSAIAHNDLAGALTYLRRFDEAIASSRRAVELGGEYHNMIGAMAYFSAGRSDSAVALAKRVAPGTAIVPGARAVLALAYAANGQWSAMDSIGVVIARSGRDDALGVEAAVVALAAGNRTPLLTVLSTPAGQRQWLYRFNSLSCSVLLDPLMRDAKYVAMLDRQGLRRCPVSTPWPIKPRAP